MITLQLKRTAKNLSDNAIKNLVLDSGEPLLIKSLTVPTSTRFDLICSTASNNSTKEVSLPQNLSNLIVIENDKPAIGTTLCIKFNNANDVTGPLRLRLNIRRGYNVEQSIIQPNESSHIYGTQYNWLSDDTRFFVFNGDKWVIQLPDYYLENPIVFVGDGKNTVDSLYKSGTYIDVSKYISGDNIENGTITIEKLDPDIGFVTSTAVDQSIADAIGDYSALVDSNFAETDKKIQLGKIYYVTCETPGDNQLKTVNVQELPKIQDEEDYDGLTLVIKFTHENTYGKYEGQNDNIALKVRNSDGTQTLIESHPLYVGNSPLGKPFYWNNNDTLIFVFNPNYDTGSGLGCWNMAGTSASTIIADWCYNNDTTYINGSSIFTGTIAADSIMSNSITAQQIAVGSLPSTVFNSDLQSIIGNLDTFKQQCASAGGIVAECETVASEQCKLASVTEDVLTSINTKNNMPLAGTSIVVKFDYINTYFSQNGISFALTTDGTNKYFEAPIFINFKGGYFNIGLDVPNNDIPEDSAEYEAILYYRWGKDETDFYRTLMYDGSKWMLQTATDYLKNLAEYCLTTGQTWIGGGTIITGTVVADQIQSGLLDTAKVQLVCYGEDGQGKVKNYGGLRYTTGTTNDIDTTRGVELYGAIPYDDPDDEPDNRIVITNAGMRIHITSGLIEGWDEKWQINAANGIFIGNQNISGSVIIGRAATNTTINGGIKFSNIPISSSGLTTGQIYNDGGTLKIVT